MYNNVIISSTVVVVVVFVVYYKYQSMHIVHCTFYSMMQPYRNSLTKFDKYMSSLPILTSISPTVGGHGAAVTGQPAGEAARMDLHRR